MSNKDFFYTSYLIEKNEKTKYILEIHPSFNMSRKTVYEPKINYVHKKSQMNFTDHVFYMACDEAYIYPEFEKRLDCIKLMRTKGIKLIIKI